MPLTGCFLFRFPSLNSNSSNYSLCMRSGISHLCQISWASYGCHCLVTMLMIHIVQLLFYRGYRCQSLTCYRLYPSQFSSIVAGANRINLILYFMTLRFYS